MYTLYYSPGACSMAVHVLLNELNVPYALERVTLHGPNGKSENILKVNPAGQVPVLTLEDGYNLREGGAILTYLCDTHGQFLAKTGTERAKGLQALMFCNSSLHPAYSPVFKYKNTELASSPIVENVVNLIHRHWAGIEEQLGKTKYLAGDQMTVADILLTVIANWNGALPTPVVYGPNTTRLLKEISSRPAYQKALASEETEYKAVA